jgi:hypothetical protein
MGKFIEPGLIGLALFSAGIMVDTWPESLSTGRTVLIFSVVFLAHTLLRDLVLLYQQKTRENFTAPKVAQVFCVESGIGMILVAFGIILFLGNIGEVLILTKAGWLFSLLFLMLINYGLKDLVFGWNPWRIYRDPNHLNIIPRL